MFSSSGAGGGKKQRPATGYLVRPRLGALRSLYSSRPFSAYPPDKRKKLKKSTLPKMDFRKRPDYADTAYREAVGRLRILLAESYAPIRRPLKELDSAGEETDNQSLVSAGSRNSRLGRTYYHYNAVTPKKYNYYPTLRSNYNILSAEPEKPLQDQQKTESNSAPPELMSFIERQEEYIEQLEKESRFCRDELSSLLSKVKDVISENENLHEKQKSKLIKSVFDHLETETETETETDNKNMLKSPKRSKKTRIIEGPSIVFESRISELEAQLTQARIDLRKALDENDSYKRKINDGTILESVGYESYKKQIDHLQREKETLQETINKLQNALAILRDKENDTCDKVKRSLDVAEQAQYEKNTADAEIRRLKDELERQHLKLRDAIADQGRRVADERSAVERRYTQQIEQLTAELGVQWETTNKLQLEVDKQRRENGDLRREVAQKQALIDELKKEMQSKIITLQTDIGVSGAEKSSLEQQISTLQLANERSERQCKQEIGRMQAEMQSLRQRLDRADADLIHSRRENIRLAEQVASLEKEINLNAAISEERSKTPRTNEIVALPPPTPRKDEREKELGSMIQDMESKHAATVAELESMIYSQNQLMDKLSTECHVLTQKLEDSSFRHKEEIRELQTSLKVLNNRFSQSQLSTSNVKDEEYTGTGNQRNASPQPTKTRIQQDRENLSRKNSNISVKPTISSRQSSQDKLQSRRSSNISVKPVIASRKSSQDKLQSSTLPPHQPQQVSKNDQQLLTAKAPLTSSDYSKEQHIPINIQPLATKTEDQINSNQQYAAVEDQQYEDESDQQYINDQYDPNAQYDHNQTYNPNQGYDLNQQYDPNQQYDSNQHYDPSQQYDPNQQYDTEQEYDPNQQYEQYETDPNRGYRVDPLDANQGYSVEPNNPSEKYSVEPDIPIQQYPFDSENSNQQYSSDSIRQYSGVDSNPQEHSLASSDHNQQYSVAPNNIRQNYLADSDNSVQQYPLNQKKSDQQFSVESNRHYAGVDLTPTSSEIVEPVARQQNV